MVRGSPFAQRIHLENFQYLEVIHMENNAKGNIKHQKSNRTRQS
jgi:hypothetical protein